MKPNRVADEIESLISEANDIFLGGIETVENYLYKQLLPILKDIETDKDGYILQNTKNRKIINNAETLIDETLPGAFQPALDKFIGVIPQIDELNNSYFTSINSDYSANTNYIKSLQRQTISSLETNLLQDGLIAQVKTPLNDILNQNINSGGSFSGMLEQVKNYIVGNEKYDGKLQSYSRGIVTDALFNYNRAFQQSITADLGLEFYLYSGGLVKDSREFCQERAGEYFHYKEIEAWAGEDWQGKNRFTTSSSIFIYCGGYNCEHQLIPVLETIVPQDVIDRNVESGNYIP